MSDTISFGDRGQFVYCRYTGPFEFEPLMGLAKAANEFCQSHGYDAILVDITESFGVFRDSERFMHGLSASKFVGQGLKIANLARRDQQSGKFWETITRNRNLKTKNFFDLATAEKWLLS